MHRAIIVALVLLAGCSASRESVIQADRARVVSLTPLPPLSSLSSIAGIRMEVLFHVHRDGSVEEVHLVESSGDPVWDRSAADSMKQWKFALATPDTSLEAQWVRTTLIVQVQEPIVMTLGELTAGTRQEADSLYALLLQGADFTTLAKAVRQDASNQCGWFLGAINISRYPPHIREALRSLALNDVTAPLQIDSRYAIFMRLEPGAR